MICRNEVKKGIVKGSPMFNCYMLKGSWKKNRLVLEITAKMRASRTRVVYLAWDRYELVNSCEEVVVITLLRTISSFAMRGVAGSG